MYKHNYSHGKSQHFLTNKSTIKRIINISTINRNDLVYEIGAGKGHITCELGKRAQHVKAIEIDKSLFAKAANRSAELNNITLIHGDFLKSSLPKHEYKIFSNIPFGITSKIMDKILFDKNPPCDAWIIMQKGAAKMYCGLPSENINSLLIKPMFDVNILYYFRRCDFHPSPNADCVLVHLRRKATPDLTVSQYPRYRKFILRCSKAGFNDFNGVFTKNQFCTAKKIAKINKNTDNKIRYVQWLCLFRCHENWNRQY